MPYKDKDKQREYQRQWVRHKRAGSTDSVEPKVSNLVRPKPEYARPEPETLKDERRLPDGVQSFLASPGVVKELKELARPEPQSYNPMMIGYVPPRG